jgi:PAS domain S-box-containing protein
MKKNLQSEADSLRQKAEEMLSNDLHKSIDQLSDVDIYKMLHELQIHQIELHLQNDELIDSREKALIAFEKYIELYDFAPSGYFTFSIIGEIIQLNLSGAKMLGKDRSQLKNKLFQHCLSDDSKSLFRLFLKKVYNSHTTESCELTLLVDNRPVYIYLSGIVSDSRDQCFVTATDISERKHSEEELLNSRLLLKASIESQKDTVLLSIDQNYRYLYFNKAHSDAMKYAYNQDVKLGMNTLEFITPYSERISTQAKYDRALKGESQSEIAMYGDVNPAFYESFFNPIYNSQNEIIGATCLSRNISSRIKAEEELRASIEFNQTLLQTIPFGMNIVDENGNILYLSEGMKEHFGADAFSKKCWQLYRDDQKQCDNCPLHSGIKTGLTETCESHDILGGKTFEVSHTGMIFNGKKAMLEIFIDITDRKLSEDALLKSEYEFRLLAESMPQIVWICEPDGGNIFFNQHWVDYTGLSLEESFGPGWNKPFHPDDQKRAWDAWHYATTNMANYSLECRLRRFDGEYKWWLVRGAPVYDKDGKVLKWFGTCTDIDEMKLTEAELLAAKEHAQESDRLKSAFLANMSHEIRTPMNGILGFAGLLKEQKLTGEQQKEYIKIIEKSGARMLNIINDIVDISKIESGQMKISLSETNVNEQMEFIYLFFKTELDQKGIKLSLKNSLPKSQSLITTDREKLYSILINLVKNAIKYTSEGSIEFGYVSSLRQTPGAADSLADEPVEAVLEFYVKDTGIGIPKDRQEAIFERFIQADIIDKHARQGAGLGLSISKAYIEMLGGRIWVESQEGKGSTFYFTLPFRIDQKVKTEYENETLLLDEKSQTNNLKILIVEDDETSSELISIKVRKLTKEIIRVRTGTEAVQACSDNPDIDLVLMDIGMPDLDGYEATRQIRKFNPQVVIIAQTAYALSGDREKAIEAGCNDYISKPIQQDLLLALLKRYFI